MFVCVCLCLFACLLIILLASLLACVPACLPVCLSVCLSCLVCLFVCLFVCFFHQVKATCLCPKQLQSSGAGSGVAEVQFAYHLAPFLNFICLAGDMADLLQHGTCAGGASTFGAFGCK